MSLKERITEDMKTAMRAKDTERLGTIRLLQAAIKQREVDERITHEQLRAKLRDPDGMGAVVGQSEVMRGFDMRRFHHLGAARINHDQFGTLT